MFSFFSWFFFKGNIGIGSVIVTEPSYELGNSEATNAMSWLPSSPNCLASGTGSRWLRIYDLRGNNGTKRKKKRRKREEKRKEHKIWARNKKEENNQKKKNQIK